MTGMARARWKKHAIMSINTWYGLVLLVVGLGDLLLGVLVLPQKVQSAAQRSVVTLVMGISGFSFIVVGLLFLAGVVKV